MRSNHSGTAIRRAPALLLSSLLLGAMIPAQEALPVDPFDDPRVLEPAVMREQLATGEILLPVIVNLKAPAHVRGFRGWQDAQRSALHRQEVKALERIVLEKFSPADFVLKHRMDNQACFSGHITTTGLLLLLEQPLVESIEVDHEVHAQTDQGITLMNGDLARSQFDGTGISIAIVDTGIDYDHGALGAGGFPNAKVIGGFDFGDNDTDPMDENGHGTQAAGVAAGDMLISGDYVGGVAPGALLYALKIVSGGEGSAFDSDIIASWDWCVTNQNNNPASPILVINTSFGGGQYSSTCDGAKTGFANAANNAVSAGITLFGSSGNDGFCAALAGPSCVSNSISVGAVYDAAIGARSWCIDSSSCIGSFSATCDSGWTCTDTSAPDMVTCYSNSASFLDILAPSNNARAPALGGGYANFGGTSAASPYAAGAAAVLLHAASNAGIFMSPDDVRATMVATGDNILDPKSSITTPRVNLGDAVASLGVWVDFSYIGTETGSASQPFNTLAEGVAAAPIGGTVIMRSGSTSVTPTITKAVTLRTANGTVIIGG